MYWIYGCTRRTAKKKDFFCFLFLNLLLSSQSTPFPHPIIFCMCGRKEPGLPAFSGLGCENAQPIKEKVWYGFQVDRGFRISPSCDPSLFSWFRSLCLVFKHRVDDGCVGRFQILSAIPSPPVLINKLTTSSNTSLRPISLSLSPSLMVPLSPCYGVLYLY